jgi:predicted metal-dependent hydrolase
VNALTVGDLHFEVRHSPRRKTLQITVDRDGKLILFAPAGCAASELEAFVRDKRGWIYTKLAEKEALRRETSVKEYVSGEGFPYLGRSYRLLLVDEQDAAVKLEAGRFRLRRSDAAEGRRQMVRWYTVHATPWLRQRVQRFAPRIEVTPAELSVQDLGYRWGSCGKGARIHFHWKSILLPPRIVEYIVAHELVHLHEPHHTPEFWHRLERAMPDFESRKLWLAEHGGAASI